MAKQKSQGKTLNDFADYKKLKDKLEDLGRQRAEITEKLQAVSARKASGEALDDVLAGTPALRALRATVDPDPERKMLFEADEVLREAIRQTDLALQQERVSASREVMSSMMSDLRAAHGVLVERLGAVRQTLEHIESFHKDLQAGGFSDGLPRVAFTSVSLPGWNARMQDFLWRAQAAGLGKLPGYKEPDPPRPSGRPAVPQAVLQTRYPVRHYRADLP